MWTLLLTSLGIPWTFFVVTFKLVSPSSQFCDHSDHALLHFTLSTQHLLPVDGMMRNSRSRLVLSPERLEYLKLDLSTSLFSFQDATVDLFYSQNWFRNLHQILLVYMKNKRLYRQSSPNYFSSHTTHLMNCFLTLMRREFVKSKYLVIKRNLLQSIELDTQLFFEIFLKFNTKMNDIYKLIESLRKISSRMKCFITITSLLDLRKLRRNSILSS